MYSISCSKNILTKPIFTLILFISIIKIGFKSGSNIKHQIANNAIQQKNLLLLKEKININSTVYISGISCAYYYLCSYKSINLKKIGYSFPGYFYPETIFNNLESNSYLILTNKYVSDYKPYFKYFNIEKLTFKQKKDRKEEVYILKKK